MCSYSAASASRTFFAPSSLAAASATALQLCPAARMCTSVPSALAAVNALAVASFSAALSCSARRSVGIRPPRFFELLDQLGDALDLDAGFAHRRLRGLDHFKARFDIDAVVRGGLLRRFGFFLCLHDVRQRSVARSFKRRSGGDDGRHLELHRLQAAVDFACHQQRIASTRPWRQRCLAASRANAASIWPV